MPGDYKNDTLFIFDEVHGAGSNSFVENLTGRISPYRYRLGLSATPEREYDDEGNVTGSHEEVYYTWDNIRN